MKGLLCDGEVEMCKATDVLDFVCGARVVGSHLRGELYTGVVGEI